SGDVAVVEEWQWSGQKPCQNAGDEAGIRPAGGGFRDDHHRPTSVVSAPATRARSPCSGTSSRPLPIRPSRDWPRPSSCYGTCTHRCRTAGRFSSLGHSLPPLSPKTQLITRAVGYLHHLPESRVALPICVTGGAYRSEEQRVRTVRGHFREAIRSHRLDSF